MNNLDKILEGLNDTCGGDWHYDIEKARFYDSTTNRQFKYSTHVNKRNWLKRFNDSFTCKVLHIIMYLTIIHLSWTYILNGGL